MPRELSPIIILHVHVTTELAFSTFCLLSAFISIGGGGGSPTLAKQGA